MQAQVTLAHSFLRQLSLRTTLYVMAELLRTEYNLEHSHAERISEYRMPLSAWQSSRQPLAGDLHNFGDLEPTGRDSSVFDLCPTGRVSLTRASRW